MKRNQLELRLTDTLYRWGVMWYSKNKLDGVTKHLIGSGLTPVLFRTRSDARDYINDSYGYIKHRKDLRVEPHGWRMPRAVRVECSYKFQEWPYV